MPPPLGVAAGIPCQYFIDVDEFGISLIEKINSRYGYASSYMRVRKVRHYTRNTKLTVLLAVAPGDQRIPVGENGSVENPRRWVRVVQGTGITAESFANFINNICVNIKTRPVDVHCPLAFGEQQTNNQRVFLWDNLNSHLSPIVAETVKDRNGPTRFSSIPRPTYQSKYGPIEYVICTLIQEASTKITPQSTLEKIYI